MEMKPTQGMPELPTLNEGIHLLETDSRTSGALQSIMLDHLLTHGGSSEAVWVDSNGNGSIEPFARLVPSMRVLERVEIARGFTAFQHYSLLNDLAAEVESETALVVLPELDWFYRSDDLHRGEGERMLSAGVTLIEDLHERNEVPILVTRTASDGFSQPRSEHRRRGDPLRAYRAGTAVSRQGLRDAGVSWLSARINRFNGRSETHPPLNVYSLVALCDRDSLFQPRGWNREPRRNATNSDDTNGRISATESASTVVVAALGEAVVMMVVLRVGAVLDVVSALVLVVFRGWDTIVLTRSSLPRTRVKIIQPNRDRPPQHFFDHRRETL